MALESIVIERGSPRSLETALLAITVKKDQPHLCLMELSHNRGNLVRWGCSAKRARKRPNVPKERTCRIEELLPRFSAFRATLGSTVTKVGPLRLQETACKGSSVKEERVHPLQLEGYVLKVICANKVPKCLSRVQSRIISAMKGRRSVTPARLGTTVKNRSSCPVRLASTAKLKTRSSRVLLAAI